MPLTSEARNRFITTLSEAQDRVERSLDALLPQPADAVTEAMRHATLKGGKRLRAFLVIESARLFHVPAGWADRAAAAVECVHAYSLIHDDLPCMDDDALRRGKPTVHVKWDEATAVLAGDALQALAFEILAAPQTGQDPQVRLRLIQRLGQAAGALGMVGGQALDMAAETRTLGLPEVTRLQALKTGALIGWAAEAGAHLAKLDASPLAAYAAELGLAFQIRDDLLDVEGDAETTGKAVGKDSAAGKATFVSLLGAEGARAEAERRADAAMAALSPYGSAAESLRALARYAIDRTL